MSETLDNSNPTSPLEHSGHRQDEDPVYRAQYEASRAGLLQSAPELLEGRLPAALEALLAGKDYALGFNQSEAAMSADEAAASLAENGGVALQGYDVPSRVLIADQSETEFAAEYSIKGYYGPNIGRFVMAFPVARNEIPTGITPGQAMRDLSRDEYLPEDFFDNPKDAISPKYVAGFIDAEGIFHANPEFMHSSEVHELGAVSLAEQVAAQPVEAEGQVESNPTPRSRNAILDNGISASERSAFGDDFSLDRLTGQVVTRIVAETDDGEMYLLRHEGPEGDASAAKFELVATSDNAERRTGQELTRHELAKGELEGISLRVGEPMLLKTLPGERGKRTRGNIIRITAWDSRREPLAHDSPKRSGVPTSDVRKRFAEHIAPHA